MAPSTQCSYCSGVPPGKLRRCSACHSAFYCNAECQKGHWLKHKAQCKELKSKMLQKTEVKNYLKIPQSKTCIVVDSERVKIGRVYDPEDKCYYQQFMAQSRFEAHIRESKMACWCTDVGSQQSLLAVFAFDPTTLPKGPANAISYNKKPPKKLRSSYLSAFGFNFQVVVTEMMGNMSVSIEDEAKAGFDRATVKGVCCRTTYFFVGGSDADTLHLPPPSKGEFRNAGKISCNTSVATWCGIGSSESVGCHEIGAMPTVPGAALQGKEFMLSPGLLVESKPYVAIAVLIEKVSGVNTKEEYEKAAISAKLHDFHAGAMPDETVPPFNTGVCKEGLRKLNMDTPVSVIGPLPIEGAAASSTFTSTPTESFTESAPHPSASMSPGAQQTLQHIIDSFREGSPDLGAIENGLADPELATVLQNILSSPQVAPMMAQMMSKITQEQQAGN